MKFWLEPARLGLIATNYQSVSEKIFLGSAIIQKLYYDTYSQKKSVMFTTRVGQVYVVGHILPPPPPDQNRVKFSAKTGSGPVPESSYEKVLLCPPIKMTFEFCVNSFLFVNLNERLKKTYNSGLLSLGVPGVPGVPWHTQILADQLTLFQPGGKIMPT